MIIKGFMVFINGVKTTIPEKKLVKKSNENNLGKGIVLKPHLGVVYRR